MALIEFKDLPDTSTPINAENLNYNFDALKGKVLWTNPNSSSEFVKQTISLDLSKYRKLEILYKIDVNNGTVVIQQLYKGIYGQVLCEVWLYDADLVLRRSAKFEDNGVEIDNCYGYGVGNHASQKGFVENANLGLIPYQIIGYE